MRNDLGHQTNLRRQRRRGFTLTEIAIVLGIVGLILGAIWVAAAAVYNNLRVSHSNTAILQTVQAVRTLYATQNSIAAGDGTVAIGITAGTAPADMVNAAGTGLTDAWGGQMFIGGTTDTLGIVLEMSGVPGTACINLVSAIGGVTRDSGLTSAKGMADGAAFAAVANVGTAVTTPVAPTTAATGCTASPTLNMVQFVFALKG